MCTHERIANVEKMSSAQIDAHSQPIMKSQRVAQTILLAYEKTYSFFISMQKERERGIEQISTMKVEGYLNGKTNIIISGFN